MALDVAVAVLSGAAGVYRDLHLKIDDAWLVPASRQLFAAVQVLGAVVIIWRRFRPLTVGAVTAGLSLISPVQGAAAVLYSIAVHGRPRLRSGAVIAAVAGAFFVGGQLWRSDDPITSPLLLSLGTVLGLYVRERRFLQDALVEQQIRAGREQVLLAAKVAADERSRLAGELHDVVSHRLNLVVLRAGALATSAADPELTAALEDLHANGVAALTELRNVFSLVHAGVAESLLAAGGFPVPAGAPAADMDLQPLLDRWRAAGTDIEFTGIQSADGLAPIIGRTRFRVVQEALTNAAKHAPGARVRVHAGVEHSVGTDGEEPGDTVLVSVRSEGATVRTDEQVRRSGGGAGLAGLEQRIGLLGGSFSAGPVADGGFCVRARLPAGSPIPTNQRNPDDAR